MNTFYIDNTNNWEITIYDDLGRAYLVPKFRIIMSVSGDYLTLTWNHSERGGYNSELIIDYNDVEVTGGYSATPSSATDLMNIINEMIDSGFDDGGGGGGGTGHSVAQFIDLLTTEHLESQWVEAFDSITGQGGGYFVFYNESNLSIPLIAGYQIKTASSATGYWRRVDPRNQWNPVWCGAINDPSAATLASQGWTQTEADTMWGSGLVDVDEHGYDDAALRYSFDLLNSWDSVTINLEPKDFYVNDTVWIPKYFEFLKLNGNFAWIHSAVADAFDIIGRPEAADLADAQVMLNCRYYFECLNINAQGSQVCLKPGPSTSAGFWMVDTYNGLQGIELEFCLNFYFLECVNKLSTGGFLIRNDDCSDCDDNNSNSNMSTMLHCRAYNEDGAGGKAFAFYGVSSGEINTCTVEGHFYANPIYIDGQNAGTIKGFNVINCHYECVDTATDDNTQAFVWVRQAGGVVRVQKAIGHYPMVMVNSGGTTGTLHVSIEDIVGWAPYTGNIWFYNDGDSTYDLINIPDLGGDPSIIAALIAGTAMFDWWSAGPGNNRFRLLATPLNAVVPGGSGSTDLSIGTITGTTVDINSSTGTDATIPAATATEAGVLTAADKVKLNNTSGVNTGNQVLTIVHYIHGTNEAMSDGATLFISARWGTSGAAAEANMPKEQVIVNGTITEVFYAFRVAFGVGTAETASVYLRVLSSAGALVSETLLSNTMTYNVAVNHFHFTGLSIAVTKGQLLVVKIVNPTYVTNPPQMDHHFKIPVTY